MAPSFLSCAAALQIILIILHLSVSVHARSLPSRDVPRDIKPDANCHQSASVPGSLPHFKAFAGELAATNVNLRVEETDAASHRVQSGSLGATLQQRSRHPWKRLTHLWSSISINQRLYEPHFGTGYQNDGSDTGIRNTEAVDNIGLAFSLLGQLFPLRALASRKQVLGGSGATFFEQDANAGSINNLGVTNSQRSRVGDGMGYASSFQGNSMSQQSATNPTLPTVYVGSSVSTTAATNGVGSSFPFAGLGTTGDVFVGVGGQLIPTGASIGD